jgi:hypothetical protein
MVRDIVETAVVDLVRVEGRGRVRRLPRRMNSFGEPPREVLPLIDPATVEGFLDQCCKVLKAEISDGALTAGPDPACVLRPKRHEQVAETQRAVSLRSIRPVAVSQVSAPRAPRRTYSSASLASISDCSGAGSPS